MNVKQIQVMLDSIDEDAELLYVWTKPMGELGDKLRFETNLHFSIHGVKSIVPIEHFKEKSTKPIIPITPIEIPLTQKLGSFFNKQV